MLFSSSIFVFGFFPICLIFYYLIPNRKIRNLFLFLASILFYAWGEPVFVLIMLSSIILNYIFGMLVEKYNDNKRTSKMLIVIMLIFNLGILFVFKYIGFFVTNINEIFNLNLYVPKIPLPIGISFFTFQAISYVIDVYRRTDSDGDIIRAQKNPVNVGLYIALFPQLIAGPIVRYKTVAEQINKRRENFNDFSEGVRRFIIGLSKKVLLSNNLALIADRAFSIQPDEISVSFAWLGAICYSLQIFFDFSGYSDMAIGLGKMFGFHFLENFNYPYISKSVSEFWRRWHISLGSWFRDYVYFPLGGSRKGIKRTIFNLSVVWFLTGFWHGANWTFMSWGIYFFIFIAIEKFIDIRNKKKAKDKNDKDNLPILILKHTYAVLVAIFGWVLFRSDTIEYAVQYIKSMLGLNGNNVMDNLTILYVNENTVFLICSILFSMPIVEYVKKKHKALMDKREINKGYGVLGVCYDIGYVTLYIGVFLITMSFIIKGAYNPFIYFNF